MSEEPTVTFPVSLVVKIFNSLPKDDSLPKEDKSREALREYLERYKERINRKGHVSEGFRLRENGDLDFDYSLYEEAVYRGKIETYTRSIQEKAEELRDKLEMLKSMGEEHQLSMSKVDNLKLEQRVGKGEPISEEEKRLLKKIMPLLLEVTGNKGSQDETVPSVSNSIEDKEKGPK